MRSGGMQNSAPSAETASTVAAPWSSFPKTATYLPSAAAVRLRLAILPLLLAGPAFFWPIAFDGTPLGIGDLAFLLATLALLALGAGMVRFALNARFAFDPHAISIRGLGKDVVLPLAQIASLTARRRGRSTGPTLVRLHSTNGTTSATITVEEPHLRDDDLLAWLASVPRRGGDPVVRVKPEPPMSRVLIVLLALMLLPAVWVLVGPVVDTARALLVGYPPLEQLSLVEGSVTHVGRCLPGGRGKTDYCR